MDQSRLTNLRGLASALRLPRPWLADEADAGRIPCLRVGRRMRFNVDAVRQSLADRATRPAPKATVMGGAT